MSNTEQQEVWKTYPEFDFIEVSNLGRVRTKDRTVTRRNGRKQFVKGRILKQQLDRYGYLCVHIRENGKSFYRKVHRMVLATFCPNPDNLPEVNHIDCDRTNNRLDNLEWCTSEYNNAYRERYGKALKRPVIAVNPKTLEVLYFDSQSEAARQLGFSQGNIGSVLKGKMNTIGGYLFVEDESEITEEKIQEVKDRMCFRGGVIEVDPETSEVFWFESQSEAARQLNVSVQSINNVAKGKQNTAGRCWFCDADENIVEKARAKFGDKIANKVEKLINEHLN